MPASPRPDRQRFVDSTPRCIGISGIGAGRAEGLPGRVQCLQVDRQSFAAGLQACTLRSVGPGLPTWWLQGPKAPLSAPLKKGDCLGLPGRAAKEGTLSNSDLLSDQSERSAFVQSKTDDLGWPEQKAACGSPKLFAPGGARAERDPR